MLREIACHRKCHSDHAALGRAIGHLPYLPVESRHRRRVDDDASFSIKLVSRSRACCKFCNHVERADQIDLDRPAIDVDRMRHIFLADSLHRRRDARAVDEDAGDRSEEPTSELQSLMRISYAVFCLKKKKNNTDKRNDHYSNNT